MIKLKNVQKVYHTGKQQIVAVDDVNLSIEHGSIFGIIGYSGAGKSSLIRVINMLEVPTNGEIVVDGQTISSMQGTSLRKVRQEIGMIFQHFNLLWSRTVHQNVAFPLEITGIRKKDIDIRVKELLELVGLTEKANAYPSQLSGGQKQRVGIARALANKPKLLLCDEATSALDPKTTDSILDLLKQINQTLQLTIVLITHEMHVIRKICHEVAVMEAGRIVELGPVTEVFVNPKQEITKEFVKQITEPPKTEESLSSALSIETLSGYVVKCTFLGDSAKQPIMNQLMKQTDLNINILQGQLHRVKEATYGTLFIQLNGSPERISDGINLLKEKGVQVEVITRG
ncbi:MAG: methionine ABC transporter ATP-binding protein [Bacilli bacterium]